ncbi:MAG: hypothetical protein NC828_00960 [Candidatus Omnitrophica bacterium]|nr:hypothetical protein [Candidatus Omnitrophota bacterium]
MGSQTMYLNLTAGIVIMANLFFYADTQAAEKEAERMVKQEEVAEYLVETRGLKVEEETPEGYFLALEKMNIKPPSGWEMGKPVTQQDLADVYVEAARLQNEVLKSGKDEVTFLRTERGITIPEGTIDEEEFENFKKDRRAEAYITTPSQAGAGVPNPQGVVIVPQKRTGLEIEPPPTTLPPVTIESPPPTEPPPREPSLPQPPSRELLPLPPTESPSKPSGS